MKSDRHYARIHAALTILVIILIAAVLAAHPTRWNVTLAVVLTIGFGFWAPIPVMLRRERRERREREREDP